MAASSPVSKDMRPCKASEARNVRSARSVSSRIVSLPKARLRGIGAGVCESAATGSKMAARAANWTVLAIFMRRRYRVLRTTATLDLFAGVCGAVATPQKHERNQERRRKPDPQQFAAQNLQTAGREEAR